MDEVSALIGGSRPGTTQVGSPDNLAILQPRLSAVQSLLQCRQQTHPPVSPRFGSESLDLRGVASPSRQFPNSGPPADLAAPIFSKAISVASSDLCTDGRDFFHAGSLDARASVRVPCCRLTPWPPSLALDRPWRAHSPTSHGATARSDDG